MTVINVAPSGGGAARDAADFVARYDGRVPRYTSYPTAPHFSPAVGASVYARWLIELPAETPLSLYLCAVLRPALPLLRLQHVGCPARIVASRLCRSPDARD